MSGAVERICVEGKEFGDAAAPTVRRCRRARRVSEDNDN